MGESVCLDEQGSSRYLFKRGVSRSVGHTLGMGKTTASGDSSMKQAYSSQEWRKRPLGALRMYGVL